MHNLKLCLHHIGGRGGSRTFPIPKIFERDVINILYDADEKTHEGIKEYYKNQKSETHVLPYALSDQCKSVLFNINTDPNTNSVFETNNAFKSFYRNYPHMDYLVGEAFNTEEKKKIEFVSFDYLYKTNKVKHPEPDFISLITGSSEYDILKGADEILKKNVLAINCEVHLHHFRKGQKSFNMLQDYLDTKGFYFVNFCTPYRYTEDTINIQSYSPFRYPLGLRGDGFDVLVHALFLKKIEEVENFSSDQDLKYINYSKLSFISFLFNQTEYGLESLKYSNKYKIKKDELIKKYSYLNFLNEINISVNKHLKIYPKTFNEFNKTKIPKDKISKDLANKKYIFKNYIKSFLRKIPLLVMSFRYLSNFFKSIKKNGEKNAYSEFEKTFIKYDLIEQAKLIKNKRKLIKK